MKHKKHSTVLGRYWQANLWLIAGLFGAWCLVTFVPAYFARELNDYFVFGWPLAFWMAAFGGPLFFLAIVAFYADRMARRDRQVRLQASEKD